MPFSKNKAQLIVALDVESFQQAKALVKQLARHVDIFKIGSPLFTLLGPQVVHYITSLGKKVFLDLKYYDIPHTVAGAVEAAVGLNKIFLKKAHASKGSPKGALWMLTVHAAGGEKMLKAAVEASRKAAREQGVLRPMIVAVTVLTSEEKQDNILPLVLERAQLAMRSGCDGVVASCDESAEIRRVLGKDLLVITPGIRPLGTALEDQKRTATPAQAITKGSNFLVVGRPIIEAEDPRQIVKNILDEIRQAEP